MKRRTYLALGASSLAAVSGCLAGFGGDGGDDGGSDGSTSQETSDGTATATAAGTTTGGTDDARGPRMGDDLPADPTPADGYPPEFDYDPASMDVDPSSFPTTETRGERVRLAPIDVVYDWYVTGRARFADARSRRSYDAAHVLGAVSSPANAPVAESPATGWPADDRVVCYCACPHHLSSILAAKLQAAGHTDVYVIDEGFRAWYDRRYPMAGQEVGTMPRARTIEGRADPAHAGETVWARHDPSGQMEAQPIAADGSYGLTLRFHDVTADSRITVETPGYTVAAPLGRLTRTVVTAETAARWSEA